MGCLKSILKKILIILIVVAFFTLGGWTFVQKKVNEYCNPPRDVFVESEKNYADFSSVSGDYQLSRCLFNVFGYKKIIAKYLPTNQKIAIYDLKNEDLVAVSDFYTNEINDKIQQILDKTKDAFITYEDFKILEKGKYTVQNRTVPYVKYSASVKNIPFKDVVGIIAAYSTKDKNDKQTTKLIVYVTNQKAFNPKIISNFVTSLKLEKNQ